MPVLVPVTVTVPVPVTVLVTVTVPVIVTVTVIMTVIVSDSASASDSDSNSDSASNSDSDSNSASDSDTVLFALTCVSVYSSALRVKAGRWGTVLRFRRETGKNCVRMELYYSSSLVATTSIAEYFALLNI